MSAEKIEQTVKNLIQTARGSNDPESIYAIRAELERLGAWKEAREAERLAENAERAQAVRA